MCSTWFRMPGLPAARHLGGTHNCLPGIAATAVLRYRRTALLTPWKDLLQQLLPAAASRTARHVNELEQHPMTECNLKAALLSQLGASDCDGVREQGGQHRGRRGEGAEEPGAHGFLQRQNGHPGPVLWRLLLPDLSQRCAAGCLTASLTRLAPLRLPMSGHASMHHN